MNFSLNHLHKCSGFNRLRFSSEKGGDLTVKVVWGRTFGTSVTERSRPFRDTDHYLFKYHWRWGRIDEPGFSGESGSSGSGGTGVGRGVRNLKTRRHRTPSTGKPDTDRYVKGDPGGVVFVRPRSTNGTLDLPQP